LLSWLNLAWVEDARQRADHRPDDRGARFIQWQLYHPLLAGADAEHEEKWRNVGSRNAEKVENGKLALRARFVSGDDGNAIFAKV